MILSLAPDRASRRAHRAVGQALKEGGIK